MRPVPYQRSEPKYTPTTQKIPHYARSLFKFQFQSETCVVLYTLIGSRGSRPTQLLARPPRSDLVQVMQGESGVPTAGAGGTWAGVRLVNGVPHQPGHVVTTRRSCQPGISIRGSPIEALLMPNSSSPRTWRAGNGTAHPTPTASQPYTPEPPP